VFRGGPREFAARPGGQDERHLLGANQLDGVLMESLTHHSPFVPGEGGRGIGFSDRRSFLQYAGLAGVSWLTPIGHWLGRASEKSPEPATSVIMRWMQGGPSQLETFDPHPGTQIAAGTGGINTAVKDVQLAPGFGRLAEEMQSVALIRSMVSKEGDHERGT